MARPKLTVAKILDWADQWQAEHDRWPEKKDGDLRFADERWSNIDQALRMGLRGLRRDQSLARVLDRHRGKRNRKQLPKFTLKQILAWADTYRKRTGRWPRSTDGSIPNTRGETWNAVEMALCHGQRGLPGGTSLAKLLAAKCGVLNRSARPKLTIAQIKSWIDRFRCENGFFPKALSGAISESKGLTWLAVDRALRRGRRGLRKTSLAKLLQRYYGVGRHLRRPPYCVDQILEWADEHKRRTGNWPNQKSGRIGASPTESWLRVNEALRLGKRGLDGSSSLARLLSQRRGVRIRTDLALLSEKLILRWARTFKGEYGHWPNREAGLIPRTNGETWAAVRYALRLGKRGLKRRLTLNELFAG